ncbi:site-specific DNA-methyltransferase [bacterium]|nr:site-specific DNA-methyltransferase [bacterium]
MKMNTNCYPISLFEIESRVSKKNGRKNKNKIFQFDLFGATQNNVKDVINEFGEKLIRIDGDIPKDIEIKNSDRFLFISYDQSKYTHGLHKYPAKFFPELPRWLIRRYSKNNDLILDPFSGSGTTNLEALLNNRHSVGIDVDPFSKFLAKVKVTPLPREELKSAKTRILETIVKYNPRKVTEKDIPKFPYRDNWFNKEIIYELSHIKKTIETLDYHESIKNFFLVCFSSIIRAVSNADNNCTRTVIRKRLNKIVLPTDALRMFSENVLINSPKAEDFSEICPRNIRVEFTANSDARKIEFDDNTFDLALTSPPYVNAVDYPRTHQLEMYWLGLASSSLTPLKKKHIGTESVSSIDYNKYHKTGFNEADNIIAKIFEKDRRRAFIAYRYIMDMHKNLSEVYRVIKTGARYVIVVGNNKIRGEIFENWKYIMKMAEDVGFRVESYFASEIIRHFIKVPREERINVDWIIVLHK